MGLDDFFSEVLADRKYVIVSNVVKLETGYDTVRNLQCAGPEEN